MWVIAKIPCPPCKSQIQIGLENNEKIGAILEEINEKTNLHIVNIK